MFKINVNKMYIIEASYTVDAPNYPTTNDPFEAA
jgi:hypothetical protein